MLDPDPNTRLAAFLAGRRPITEEGIIWGPRSRFLCLAYACDRLPPLDLATSVRCIVLRGDAVLALVRPTEDRDGAHIVPGGRREPDESIEQTMRREVLEETGWTLGPARLLGAVVYRHQSPRPAGYPFPYPEFVQIVYTAGATAHRPEAMAPDEFDGDPLFVPIEQAHDMRISAWQRAFLDLAVAPRDEKQGQR